MEEIIAKFEAVMDQYNADYTDAKDGKEQDKVNAKFEPVITKAEADMEAEIEAFISEEADALLKEQIESEREFQDDLVPIVAEVAFLKSEGFTAKEIAKRYNLSNRNKNGFSTREIYEHVTGEGAGNEKEKTLSEAIHKALQD